jgi:hypothetical protein
MMKKTFTILNILLVVTTLLMPVEALAANSNDINSADVVILVDFSGSITNDIRYPEAEKKALLNLVNVDWPKGSQIAILAFGASDSRNGGKPSTFPMCSENGEPLRSVENMSTWIDQCAQIIGTKPVGPNTDHNKAIHTAVDLLLNSSNENSSKFVLLMTDGKLDVDNLNPVNPDYIGTSEEKDNQAIEELFTEVLPLARENGIQIWPVGFGDVNRIELNGYAPEGGQPGPDSCQREIPRAVIAEPEDLPYEINKIIRQVTCLAEYIQSNEPIVLPDFADKAKINVKHPEGETFQIQGPSGEVIESGGVGTESTIEIENPTGGNWQIISDTPLEAGYSWEATFVPEITCPIDSDIVEVRIVPSNNDSNSIALSPLFDLDLVINGEKESVQLELGETTTIQITEEEAAIFAEPSGDPRDQPGILSYKSTQSECVNKLEIQVTPPVVNEITEVAVDEVGDEIDCELTPEKEECDEPFVIPWWLIVLFLITFGYLVWLFLKSRKLKEGTFVFFDSTGEQGRLRVKKNTNSLAFNISEQNDAGSRILKSNPEEYGSYEITKGKKGVDFFINGPTGSGEAQEKNMSIGEEIELDNEYKMTFEDGTNKKPIIVDVDDPFNDQATGSLTENDVISDEGDVNDPFQ